MFAIPKKEAVVPGTQQPEENIYDYATEANSAYGELKNAATSSGQTLSPYQYLQDDPNTFQLAQAMATYALAGTTFIDQGSTGDAYILVRPTNNPLVSNPSLLAGASFSFIPNFSNTGGGTVLSIMGSVDYRIYSNSNQTELLASDIQAGELTRVAFTGTFFVLEDSIQIGFNSLLNTQYRGDIRLSPFSKTELPKGWVVCDGATYSRLNSSEGRALNLLPTELKDNWGIKLTNVNGEDFYNVPDLMTNTGTFYTTDGTYAKIGEYREGSYTHAHVGGVAYDKTTTDKGYVATPTTLYYDSATPPINPAAEWKYGFTFLADDVSTYHVDPELAKHITLEYGEQSLAYLTSTAVDSTGDSEFIPTYDAYFMTPIMFLGI